MKFLEILLSFLSTQGKSFLQTNTEALTQTIVNNARKVAILLSGATISITLFCVGFSMGYRGLVEGFSSGEETMGEVAHFTVTHELIGGLVLCVAAFFALKHYLSEKSWLRATGVSATPAPATSATSSGPGLETAFAVLVMEIVSELKDRRQHRAEDPEPTPPPSHL